MRKIICILSFLFINTAFGLPQGEYTAKELKLNKKLDQTFEEMNKEPKKK